MHCSSGGRCSSRSRRGSSTRNSEWHHSVSCDWADAQLPPVSCSKAPHCLTTWLVPAPCVCLAACLMWSCQASLSRCASSCHLATPLQSRHCSPSSARPAGAAGLLAAQAPHTEGALPLNANAAMHPLRVLSAAAGVTSDACHQVVGLLVGALPNNTP